jgi:hypothetical protein
VTSGVSSGISKVEWVLKLLILRGPFFYFLAFFDSFRRFSIFWGADFPVCITFSSPRYGILAPRKRPCTIGHRKRVLKRANWAPKVAVFIFVDLGIKPLVLFTRIVLEYLQQVFMALAGPTPRTHWSSAKRGGLDTLFTSFFTLFWVAKSLNSAPKSWANLIKPHEISILDTLGVLGFGPKSLCRTY